MSSRARGPARRRVAFAALAIAFAGPVGLMPASGAASRSVSATDEPALPLTVQIDAVQPAAITPGTTVTLRGNVTTDGPTVSHLHVALRTRGLAGRADLAQLRTSPNSDGDSLPAKTELIGGTHRTVHAGQQQPFRVTFAADDLIAVSGASDFAAKLVIAVRGTTATGTGDDATTTSEQGSLAIAVPVVPSAPQEPPLISLVVPLTVPPTNPLGPAPLPTSETVQRIEAVLNGLVAGATEAGNGASWLTIAVDPALVEQLCAAAGCGDAHPALAKVPKALALHASKALSWLQRAATTSGINVAALPYADADLDAFLRAGQSDRVDELVGDAGTQLHDLLGIAAPRVDPALPPDGELTRAAVDELISDGTGTAIVDNTMLPVAPGVASIVATQSASAALTGSHGLTLPALVTDPGLQQLVATADGGEPGQVAPAAESLLAETGAITAELPNADQRALVIVTPRLWSAANGYVHAIARGLGSATWLKQDTLAHATALPGVERTQTLASSADDEIPVATIAAIARLRDDVAAATELPSATTKAATERLQDAVREPLLSALSRASSSWWRTDPTQATALTDAVHARTQKILHGISISVASSVLVTGSSGKVPVQLENTLEFAVAVKVELSDVSGRLAPFSHVFPLPAATQGRSGKAQESLTVTSRSAGRFAAQLQLATPSGVVLGDSQVFQVRSQNYGTIAVGITAGALFLLVVAIVVRSIRALRRRRSQRGADSTPSMPTTPSAAGA